MQESSLSGRFPIKFVSIDQNTVAEHSIVAAVAEKRIRVVHFALVVAAAQTIRFRSGAAGTVISGVMSLAANGGVAVMCEDGLFETAVGAALIMQLTTTGQTGGHMGYMVL